MLNLDDQVILQQKKSSAIVVGILMVSYAHAYSEEPPFYNLAGLTEITKKKNLTSFWKVSNISTNLSPVVIGKWKMMSLYFNNNCLFLNLEIF